MKVDVVTGRPMVMSVFSGAFCAWARPIAKPSAAIAAPSVFMKFIIYSPPCSMAFRPLLLTTNGLLQRTHRLFVRAHPSERSSHHFNGRFRRAGIETGDSLDRPRRVLATAGAGDLARGDFTCRVLRAGVAGDGEADALVPF